MSLVFCNVLLEKYKLEHSGEALSWKSKSENVFLREVTSAEEILTFESKTSQDDQFEYRMRAWVEVPLTGNYKFAIAGDDYGILYLGQGNLPGDREEIAKLIAYTPFKSWHYRQGQISEEIPLIQGQIIYIEARSREFGGGDHLAIAWNYSEVSAELSSSNFFTIPQNLISRIELNRPEIQIHASVPSLIYIGSEIEVKIDKKDPLSQIESYDIYLDDIFIQNFNKSDAIKFKINVEGNKRLKVIAKNNTGLSLNSCHLDVMIFGDQISQVQGVTVEIWDDIVGWRVADLMPFLNKRPSRILHLNSFEEYFS